MFNRALIMAVLVAVPCFGAYNSKDFFVKYKHETGKWYFPKCTGSPNCKHVIARMTVTMKNVPLYFAEPNGDRDYVRNLSVIILKNSNNTYNMTYAITASRQSENLSLKDMQPERINTALKDNFPRAFDASATKGSFTQDIVSLYALQQSECNRELFNNLMKLVNNLIITSHKLHFDEEDLFATPKYTASIYNPKGFYFEAVQENNPGEIPVSIFRIEMYNPPLFLHNPASDKRDYIKSIAIQIQQQNPSGIYVVTHDIYAQKYGKSSPGVDITSKTLESLLPLIHELFPYALPSEIGTKSKNVTQVSSFAELKDSESNKIVFNNAVTLINELLRIYPTFNKVHFDENDLLVPAPATGWRAWISWLRGQ